MKANKRVRDLARRSRTGVRAYIKAGGNYYPTTTDRSQPKLLLVGGNRTLTGRSRK